MSISETKERSMVPYVSAKRLVVAIHYIIWNALAVSLKKLAEYREAKLIIVLEINGIESLHWIM